MIEQYIKETTALQLNREEIKLIIAKVTDLQPCNMLVFGVGYDTKIWHTLNTGKTIFLEHDQKYIDQCKIIIPEAEIIKIHYKHKYNEWEQLLNKNLFLTLPDDIKKTQWDIIFVDAPVGNINGRMESIYTAAKLNYKFCFIHDCERNIERTYANKYFGSSFSAIRKLRIYGNPNAN